MNIRFNKTTPRRAIGFTMLEVMFAIMILGIGLIAISSIFPVAGQMQKSTFDEVMGQQIGLNAMNLINERGLFETAPTDPGNDQVQQVPQSMLEPGGRWPLGSRCQPAKIDVNDDQIFNASAAEDSDFNERAYYWEPLYRKDQTTGEWEVFIIVMKRVGSEVPEIELTSDPAAELSLGEMVVSQKNGTIGAVTKKTGGSIEINNQNYQSSDGQYYHGKPFGDKKTTLRVLVLGNEAIE